jgi:hypothetical protein
MYAQNEDTERAGSASAAMQQQLANNRRSTMRVAVKTGNRPFAGTDCEVLLNVYVYVIYIGICMCIYSSLCVYN